MCTRQHVAVSTDKFGPGLKLNLSELLDQLTPPMGLLHQNDPNRLIEID
jgi:hypothetical protein